MANLYNEIEPYAHGMLDVGDGNLIYWEQCGNPDGKPVVVLHGGPGSGCSPHLRRYFDPTAYRIVLFDQRNCGRSKPNINDPTTDLSANTTQHLVADIELLRQHLLIDRWMLFGGSWGTTLGLAYAEKHPQHITEIVFFGITMTRSSEIHWLHEGVSPMFPEQWARFRAGVPEHERQGDLIEAYHRLLYHPDPLVCNQAAKDWHDWEVAAITIDPNFKPSPLWSNPDYRLARARIVTHYFRHNAWLEDGVLLREAQKLNGIPGILIQGRLDLGAPMMTAWELRQAWADSELIIIEGAGHAITDNGVSEALIAATDRLAKTNR
jgi:proline iminopeptidase